MVLLTLAGFPKYARGVGGWLLAAWTNKEPARDAPVQSDMVT